MNSSTSDKTFKNSINDEINTATPEMYAQWAAYCAVMHQQKKTSSLNNERQRPPKCHLHPKPNYKCQKCNTYKDWQKSRKSSAGSNDSLTGQTGSTSHANKFAGAESEILELMNTSTFNFPPIMKQQLSSSNYLRTLIAVDSVDPLIEELKKYCKDAEPYAGGGGTVPSTLFCCLFRLFQLRLSRATVGMLVNYVGCPFVRCAGFLYIRFGLAPKEYWQWLSPHLFDDEEFTPSADRGIVKTMGEYVESLILEDRYFNVVMPRMPPGQKREIGLKVVSMQQGQVRERTKQNKAILSSFRPETAVEACSNGDWLQGEVVELIGANTSRVKVKVSLEDGSIEDLPLGMVILAASKNTFGGDIPEEWCDDEIEHEDGNREYSRGRDTWWDTDTRRGSGGRNWYEESMGSHENSVTGVGSGSGSAGVGDTCETGPDLTRSRGSTGSARAVEYNWKAMEREKAEARGTDYCRPIPGYKKALTRPPPGSRRRSRSRSPIGDDNRSKGKGRRKEELVTTTMGTRTVYRYEDKGNSSSGGGALSSARELRAPTESERERQFQQTKLVGRYGGVGEPTPRARQDEDEADVGVLG